MVFVPSTLSAIDTRDDGLCSKHTNSNRYTKTMVFAPSTLSAINTEMVFVPSTLSAIDTLRLWSLFQARYQPQIHLDNGLCSKHAISNRYTETMVFVPSMLSATDTPRLWSLFQARYQQQIHWDYGLCSKHAISNKAQVLCWWDHENYWSSFISCFCARCTCSRHLVLKLSLNWFVALNN